MIESVSENTSSTRCPSSFVISPETIVKSGEFRTTGFDCPPGVGFDYFQMVESSCCYRKRIKTHVISNRLQLGWNEIMVYGMV